MPPTPRAVLAGGLSVLILAGAIAVEFLPVPEVRPCRVR